LLIVVSSARPGSKSKVLAELASMGLSVVERSGSSGSLGMWVGGFSDFYEEASLLLNSALEEYRRAASTADRVLGFHPLEEIALLKQKSLRVDPLTRSSVESLIKEAQREVESLKKPDFVVYVEPCDPSPEERWLSRELSRAYAGLVGSARLAIVREDCSGGLTSIGEEIRRRTSALSRD